MAWKSGAAEKHADELKAERQEVVSNQDGLMLGRLMIIPAVPDGEPLL